MPVTTPIPSTQAAPTATSIPREYVHKTAEAEVLLTGWTPLTADTHHITARWPAHHPFYGPKNGFHDPLLIAESVRQAVPLLSHAAYGVPFGHRQSWSSFSYHTHPAALAFTGRNAAIDLYITCTDVARRAGRLSSLHMHADLTIDGRRAGTAHTAFRNIPSTVYPRLRGPYADPAEAARRALPLSPPIPPAHVNRTHHQDVVLSSTNTPTRTQLRTDLTHPTLFDHPLDHAPGMLLLEAARQTAHTIHHPNPVIPTRFHARFSHYTELDTPCWITHTTTQNPTLNHRTHQITATQNSATTLTATVATTPA